MRTIIAGSRGIKRLSVVYDAVESIDWEITEVLSGTAQGIDVLGEIWAIRHNIPITRWPADWKKWGRTAGRIRNELMAANADALIAIWDGESPGTRHMIQHAYGKELQVYVHKEKVIE